MGPAFDSRLTHLLLLLARPETRLEVVMRNHLFIHVCLEGATWFNVLCSMSYHGSIAYETSRRAPSLRYTLQWHGFFAGLGLSPAESAHSNALQTDTIPNPRLKHRHNACMLRDYHNCKTDSGQHQTLLCLCPFPAQNTYHDSIRYIIARSHHSCKQPNRRYQPKPSSNARPMGSPFTPPCPSPSLTQPLNSSQVSIRRGPPLDPL